MATSNSAPGPAVCTRRKTEHSSIYTDGCDFDGALALIERGLSRADKPFVILNDRSEAKGVEGSAVVCISDVFNSNLKIGALYMTWRGERILRGMYAFCNDEPKHSKENG
jgi:hypothetical protein